MIFLVLLLVLLIEKLTDWRQAVQRDQPWLALLRAVEGRSGMSQRPWLGLMTVVVVPALLLGVLLAILEPLAYGWLSLPVHLLVLLYSLGRGHAKEELGSFRDAWRRGDEEAAALVAERDLGLAAADAPALLRSVETRFLWLRFQGFFAVIFWYLLLGPVAALAYRLLVLSAEHARNEAVRERARQVLHAFDWPVARVLLVSLGLVGNFVAVNRVLLPELLSWDTPARQLLDQAGPAAAELGDAYEGDAGLERLDSLSALLTRTRLLWYALIALWTLFG